MKKRKNSKKTSLCPKPKKVFNKTVDNPVNKPVDKMLKTYAEAGAGIRLQFRNFENYPLRIIFLVKSLKIK